MTPTRIFNVIFGSLQCSPFTVDIKEDICNT